MGLTKNPGSIDQFSEQRGLVQADPETIKLYDKELGEYCLELALQRSISLAELHELPLQEAS